jgi:hypothetical protein
LHVHARSIALCVSWKVWGAVSCELWTKSLRWIAWNCCLCSCRRRIDNRPLKSWPAKLDFARSFANATAVGLTKCKSISVKGLDHAFADVSGIIWQEVSSDREWFECSSGWWTETERERGQQYVSACRRHFVNRFVLSLFCTCKCVFLDAAMNTPPPR